MEKLELLKKKIKDLLEMNNDRENFDKEFETNDFCDGFEDALLEIESFIEEE